MKFDSFALPEFWACYDALPEEIQRQADKRYELFLDQPNHPSLQLEPVGKFWSVRVSLSHRAVAVRRGNRFFWFWIGDHDGYERLVK